MSKFYSFNNFNNNLELDAGFNYNRYELKETLTDHNNIVRSNSFNKKEIFLNINFKAYYSKSPLKHISELNKSKLLSFSDIKLKSQHLSYFNNLNKKSEFLIKNVNLDKSKSKSLYELFGVNYINFQEEFSKNKKVSVDREKLNYIKKCNKSNMFFEKDFLYENDNEEFYLNSQVEKSYIQNKKNFLSNLTSYNIKTIYDSPDISHSFVGFFIEKYVKVEEGYFLLDRRFYIDSDITQSIADNINNKTLSIKDTGIKYGKTYKYKVMPVYSITFPKFNDFHLAEDYLFCDVPFFTKDIECKEYRRPLPPNNIRFRYNKESNKLVITWNLIPDDVGDIKGFQVFKRSSLKDPFVLVKQIEYHDIDDLYSRNEKISSDFIEVRDEVNSFELETELRKEKIEIYTICSIDAHGFVSNYSAQLGVKFNFSSMKTEVDLVSRSGAPINMPNLFIDRKTKFFSNEDKIVTITPKCSNVEKISIYATPDFATINTDELQEQNIYTYKEKYKFNIFKLENSENFIDTIQIDNFDIWKVRIRWVF